MSRILVKFATRERPYRFKQVLKGWASNASDLTSIDWLFSFDTDDRTMRESRWLKDIVPPDQTTVCYGVSESKIHAINRDVNEYQRPWDILLVLSDDMVCVRKGWDEVIRKDMELHYPDGDGMLWFFDSKQAAICTLPCMGRTYYDRFGYVYHPSYRSVFSDDEATAIARSMGKLTFFEDVLAEHRHPANFTSVRPDELYRRNETPEKWAADEANYFERKANGFPA